MSQLSLRWPLSVLARAFCAVVCHHKRYIYIIKNALARTLDKIEQLPFQGGFVMTKLGQKNSEPQIGRNRAVLLPTKHCSLDLG